MFDRAAVTFGTVHPDLLRCWGTVPGSGLDVQCENRVDPDDGLGLCGRCLVWKRGGMRETA